MIYIEFIIEFVLLLIIFWITSITILKNKKMYWSIPFFIVISVAVFEGMSNLVHELNYYFIHISFLFALILIIINVFRGGKNVY